MKLNLKRTHGALGIALTLVSAAALSAGSLSNTRVTEVRVDADGKGMVFFESALTGSPPSCGTTPPYNKALAFNTNGTSKYVLALALAAKASGSPIHVVGTGSCGIYGNFVEDWSYGMVAE